MRNVKEEDVPLCVEREEEVRRCEDNHEAIIRSFFFVVRRDLLEGKSRKRVHTKWKLPS